MKSYKFLSILGVALFLLTGELHAQEPGPNQAWSECGNNRCQPTCDDFYEWQPDCVGTCTPGYICFQGYLRNRFGQCVEAIECGNGVCKENEEYLFCRPCPKGFACGGTCRGPSVCECISGYIRDQNGTCYKPVTTAAPVVVSTVSPPTSVQQHLTSSTPGPIPCGANEVFDICPLAEKTCANCFKGSEPTPVPDACNPRCVCKPGYVRKNDGKCVLPRKCCADPNANAVRCPYRCGGGTCAHPAIPGTCSAPCPATAPNGCQCKRGYTRLTRNAPKCIPISRCP